MCIRDRDDAGFPGAVRRHPHQILVEMGQDGLAGDVLGVDGVQGLRGPAHADVQGHAIPVLGAAGQQAEAQGGGQVAPPVLSAGASPNEIMTQVTDATQLYLNRITEMTNELSRLQETTSALNKVSDVLLESYRAITENSASITESSRGYVAQMEDLNRNIGGLNTIYEIQLKGVAGQLDSIDRVNKGIKDIRDMYEKSSATSARYCEETEKMARYMQQLNGVYEKMITAMTINMYRPMVSPDGIPTPPPAPGSETSN